MLGSRKEFPYPFGWSGCLPAPPPELLWVQLHGFPLLQQRWSMPAGSSLSCWTETLSEGSQNNWEVSCLCTQNKTSTFFPSLCKSFSWQQHNSPGSNVPWVTEACDPAAGCHFHGNPWFSECYCFCFTTASTAYRLFLEVSGLVPFSEQLHKKPWGHFYSTLGVGFWTDALQKEKD